SLGILVKGLDALEAAGDITMVVLDKTGTLTTGRMTVVALTPVRGDADRAWQVAAALESASEHPIARAITATATARGCPAPLPEQVRVHPGSGIEAMVDGVRCLAGSPLLVEQAGLIIPA